MIGKDELAAALVACEERMKVSANAGGNVDQNAFAASSGLDLNPVELRDWVIEQFDNPAGVWTGILLGVQAARLEDERG
jgi:hypothetical protein